ncbi:MAG: hypothetical protein O8C64_09790 [Candidatus Methanoperedens sp.]|nr:hypothetical protein [Candidatus Methanoperedens sp.]MCZ7404580.1 hypothetical protein [Candidatus Methanoperedens sp.]
MNLYSIDDTVHLDAFKIPSIFDDRLALYKEWHDFVFYDRKARIFGLLNFGIHGNPFDAKRGYGSVLSFFVDPQGRILTESRIIPLGKLQISAYNPDFLGEDVAVNYLKDNTFKIKGKIDKISFDLSLPVILPPVSSKEIVFDVLGGNETISIGMIRAAGEMRKFWDNWVECPGLLASGEVTLDGTVFPINTRTGYHDHEGGRFDWGAPWGWDTGVILCDPSNAKEPASARFLFYRYGPSDELSYGGFIVEKKNGKKKYFGSDKIEITRSGRFSGEQSIIPGITRLIYPDYNPCIPEKIEFLAVDGSDNLNIIFKPRAVCSVIASSVNGTSDTELNEMFCTASLSGSVGGKTYNKTIPCWFESVRPRGSVRNYDFEA